MGAAEFSVIAYGKTPMEAFNAAREEAMWEHGHGGYSGTVAEKRDFVYLELPPRVRLKTVLGLLDERYDLDYMLHDAKYVVACCKEVGVGARKKWDGKTLVQAEREVLRQEKRVERWEAKVAKSPAGVLVRRAAPLYRGDKWGPALCLGPVPGKTRRGAKLYYFTGLASE